MKILRRATVCVLLLVAACFFTVAQSVFAGGSPAAKAKTDAATSTNFMIVEVPVPVAVFDLTNKIVKDPFFPNTQRVPIPLPVVHASVAISSSCFVLKALSGTPDQRLALINNRTLAQGESAEVTTSQCGKIKITCLEIKEASVMIHAGSQAAPIEVFLPRSAR